MATRPTLVSHGGVKGTCDNPRNLSDEHVRAIAAGGGVVGIGYFELAVCGTDPRDVVAAIRHVVDLVGDDHVALGSDYDGAATVGFDTSQLRALTQEMLEGGLPEDSVRKILGAQRAPRPAPDPSAALTRAAMRSCRHPLAGAIRRAPGTPLKTPMGAWHPDCRPLASRLRLRCRCAKSIPPRAHRR